MSDTNTTNQPNIPENAPKISVDDIKNSIRIIDFAAEQGAFKGWKVIEQVLLVRNRLNEFVLAVAPTEAVTETSDDVTETTSLQDGATNNA